MLTVHTFIAALALLASGGLNDDQVKWLATGFAAFVAIFAGGYYFTGLMANIKKLREKPAPPPPATPQPLLIQEAKEVATKDDLEDLAVRLNGQWEERFEAQNAATSRTLETNNAELHRLATAMQGFTSVGHAEREGIHNRLNPLAEKTAEMNAKLSILLTHILPPSHPAHTKE